MSTKEYTDKYKQDFKYIIFHMQASANGTLVGLISKFS
jgi:hypothetical protein